MRLRAQLMAGTLLFTFLLTAVLSLVFLSEVLRERVSQTQSENNVLLHEILASTRSALQKGLAENPPTEAGEEAFAQAVRQALQNSDELAGMLNGLVRYSPDMQDAYVSSADGHVLVSTDPALVDSSAPHRRSFDSAAGTSLLSKRKILFGAPETLDLKLPLDRNGQPFLTAHIGIRSTFLRNAYAPWLRDAVIVCVVALGGSLLVAAALAALALRPIEKIGRELEVISARNGEHGSPAAPGRNDDAVERVNSTISRLDEQIRSSEQTRSEMAMNLNSMLQTLTDGVMLFAGDGRVMMANDAVSRFLPPGREAARGASLAEVFPAGSALGSRLPQWLAERHNIREELALEDGRTIHVSLDFFPGGNLGALLTMQDVAAREELEREIEVSRRLASIGRLTAGVGHEVKNPINAMVVHLELLRGKLGNGVDRDAAQRHVDVLASEMNRLDRVVQTLADFSRPLEPQLHEQPLLPIVQAVVQLISAEADSHDILITLSEESTGPLRVLCDAELLRQALLNIALNAMQAMPDGGSLRIRLSRDRQAACISLRDTGTGIEPDKLGRIFDLYFTTKASGSGIGLAMTYRIVQMHGGVIDVRSETDPEADDRGTVFTLRLPLSARTSPAHPKAVPA